MAEPAYLVFETGGAKLVAGVAGPDCRILETTILHRKAGDRAEKSFRRLIEAGLQLKEKNEAQGSAGLGAVCQTRGLSRVCLCKRPTRKSCSADLAPFQCPRPWVAQASAAVVPRPAAVGRPVTPSHTQPHSLFSTTSSPWTP